MTSPNQTRIQRTQQRPLIQTESNPTPEGTPAKQSVRVSRRKATASADPTIDVYADQPEPTAPPAAAGAFVRRPGSRLQSDLSGMQEIKGSHIGDRYVRVMRHSSEGFDKSGPGYLVATEQANEARSTFGRGMRKLKRVVIGAPLATAASAHERLSNSKALAVLSSDALSSVAYATEEILRVLLVTAGIAAMVKVLPIGAAIVTLLLIVGISYRQTIKAYPQGGGAYIVAKDNLGELPSLTAAASLLTSYVLTVSVSIAAAVAAILSAVPELRRLARFRLGSS